MDDGYSANTCDLCGSAEYGILAHWPTGRAMRSDRRVVATDLRKLRCTRCGLVRSGESFDDAKLLDCYASEYEAAPADYTFYTPQGPLPRSAAFCQWITDAVGASRLAAVRRCLEIGAGSGALLERLQRRFPHVKCEGLELNRAAALAARERGLDVHSAGLGEWQGDAYDLIYSVAVLEHVPSPTRFLSGIRRRLQPGGLLILSQPTQEVPSTDILYLDHLHHFGAEHLRQYAPKCGFREVHRDVGHAWMPNFSLHVWEAGEAVAPFRWTGPATTTTCEATARQMADNFTRLNARLAELQARKRAVGVFGLSEVYGLARAYSSLGSFPVACGLDDRPDQPDYQKLGFPVVTPEACRRFAVEDVILAVNKVFHTQLLPRLARLGVAVHPVLN